MCNTGKLSGKSNAFTLKLKHVNQGREGFNFNVVYKRKSDIPLNVQ